MKLSKLAVLGLGAIAVLNASSSAQESAQLIAAPAVIGTDIDCFRMAPDLNGDGDKDAVGLWFQGSGTMRVAGWHNDGSGLLTPGWSLTLPTGLTPPQPFASPVEVHVAVGDLNGDGAEDFAFSLDNFVGWWLSNGDMAAPTVAWAVSLPLPVRDLAVADFDLDGNADVAALTWEDVRIYRTVPPAPPVLASVLTLPQSDGIHLAVAELSGDTTPDVAVLKVTEFSVHPVLGGVIQPGTTWPSPMTATSGIAAGDVDGDGDPDLVVSSDVLGTMTTGPQLLIRVVRRTGPATLVPEPAQTLPPYGIGGNMLADVDFDGAPDLVASLLPGGVGYGQALSNPGGGGAIVWRNLGGGAFGSHQIWSLAGTRGALAITDLDGDGDNDVIAGRCVGYGVPGRGVLPDELTVNPGALNPPEDWDRDGDPDLTPGSGQYLTAINDGNGSFALTSVAQPAAAAGTSYLGPGFRGDFDGDGDVDLLVEHVNGTSVYAGFEMRLLANAGGGGLVDGGQASPTGTTMRLVPTDGVTGAAFNFTLDDRTVLVADVDGDLDQDVAVLYPQLGAFPGEQGSKIWLNDGTGFFNPGPGMPGFRPTAAGDLTGDGIPDLVAMQRNFGSPLLVVLAGLGGGTFAPPSVLMTAVGNLSAMDEPAMVDLDQDGDRDIVAVAAGALTAFTNDGFGNFSSSTIGPVDLANAIHVIRTGDLNGDGRADALTTVSTGVRVWLSDPAGPGWLAPRNWSAGLGSLSDVDGDGDLDLLSHNALYQNTKFSPPTNGLRRQYGAGLAGSGGFAPVIGSTGVLRPGFSGEIRISNALGGAAGFLGLGVSETSQSVLGGTLLIVPDVLESIALGGAPGVSGAGYLAIPWTLPAALAGFQFFGQAAIVDPSAPQGIALTQGIRWVIGN
jgi:FG-GAP-like repeat